MPAQRSPPRASHESKASRIQQPQPSGKVTKTAKPEFKPYNRPKNSTKSQNVEGPGAWWIDQNGGYRGTSRPTRLFDDRIITDSLNSLATTSTSRIADMSPLPSPIPLAPAPAVPTTAVWANKVADIANLKPAKVRRDNPLAATSSRITKPSRLSTISKFSSRAQAMTTSRSNTLEKFTARSPVTTENRTLSSAKSQRPVRDSKPVKKYVRGHSDTKASAFVLPSPHVGHTDVTKDSYIPMLGHHLPPRPNLPPIPSSPPRRRNPTTSSRRRDRTDSPDPYDKSDARRRYDRSASHHRHDQLEPRRQQKSDYRRNRGSDDSYRPRGSPRHRRHQPALAASHNPQHGHNLESQPTSNAIHSHQSELEDGEVWEGQGIKEQKVVDGTPPKYVRSSPAPGGDKITKATGGRPATKKSSEKSTDDTASEHVSSSPARGLDKIARATDDGPAATKVSLEKNTGGITSEHVRGSPARGGDKIVRATDEGPATKESLEKNSQESSKPAAEVKEPASVLTDREIRIMKLERMRAGIVAKNEQKERRKHTMNGY